MKRKLITRICRKHGYNIVQSGSIIELFLNVDKDGLENSSVGLWNIPVFKHENAILNAFKEILNDKQIVDACGASELDNVEFQTVWF